MESAQVFQAVPNRSQFFWTRTMCSPLGDRTFMSYFGHLFLNRDLQKSVLDQLIINRFSSKFFILLNVFLEKSTNLSQNPTHSPSVCAEFLAPNVQRSLVY